MADARQGRHFPFEETEGEVFYEVNTTNDDEEFLKYLLSAREQLIQMLDNGCRFDSLSILNYGKEAQNACLESRELPDPIIYEDKDGDGKRLIMDIADINNLFFHDFFHPRLQTQSPFLYQLCHKYIVEFELLSRLNKNVANRKLMALKTDLYRKIPEMDRILDRYYEYYLQTEFLTIFEDYSFSKNLLFGMAKTNMLWVLIALFAKNMKSISDTQIAKIIAVFERRAPRLDGGLKYI